MTQVPLRVKITKKVYLARKGHDLFQMSRHLRLLSISFLWWVWKCRTRDSSNSNRYCHTSQSAEDSEQKIFISIVVIVVAILFFFGLNLSADANLPKAPREFFTSTPGGLNGSAEGAVSDAFQKLPETNGWLPSWLFSQVWLIKDSYNGWIFWVKNPHWKIAGNFLWWCAATAADGWRCCNHERT